MLWAVPPSLCKLRRCTGYLVFKTWLHPALGRTGQRSEEIRCCLTRWAVEAHIGEEITSFVGGPEIDLMTFIKHDNLVKYL